jgi:hypothetical protein
VRLVLSSVNGLEAIARGRTAYPKTDYAKYAPRLRDLPCLEVEPKAEEA